MFKKNLKDEKLTPELYRAARENGTEAPFSGKYVHRKEKGMYRCAVCGNGLFSFAAKSDSGTGWPSFTEPANLKNIELKKDLSGGMRRIEVICENCGAHLGLSKRFNQLIPRQLAAESFIEIKYGDQSFK